jgi:hypothetical protein
MVKGHDQRATVVAENSPQPNLLSKIRQAFSPVKRYNAGKSSLPALCCQLVAAHGDGMC